MVQRAPARYGAQMRHGRGVVFLYCRRPLRRDGSTSGGQTQFFRRFFGLRCASWALW